jgi:hypothetical protein
MAAALLPAALAGLNQPQHANAEESSCTPSKEQWTAHTQNMTEAIVKKLGDLITNSEFSQKFFDELQTALVTMIKETPESQYLVRMADQEIFKSLIEQFKLDDDFKKIFSYKLLGGERGTRGDGFLIDQVTTILQIYNNNNNDGVSFTKLLIENRNTYLKNFEQKAQEEDSNELAAAKTVQSGGQECGKKCMKTRKLKRAKRRMNTKKKRSRARSQNKRSLRRRRQLHRRKTMRGGIITIGGGLADEAANEAANEAEKLVKAEVKEEGEEKKGEKEEKKEEKKKEKKEGEEKKGEEGEVTGEGDGNVSIETNSGEGTTVAEEQKIIDDTLARIINYDSTDENYRTIILDLIRRASNNALETNKDLLNNIISVKMKNFFENVYNNLTLSSNEIFGFLMFCSFLYNENKNTVFGNFVDNETSNIKNNKMVVTIDDFKKIFRPPDVITDLQPSANQQQNQQQNKPL